MIGPKIFDEQEREALLDKVMPLDARVAEADAEVAVVCTTLTERTDKYEADLRKAGEGTEGVDVLILRDDNQVSRLNPDLTFQDVATVAMGCTSQEAFEAISDEAKTALNGVVDTLKVEYGGSMAETFKELDPVLEKQREAYDALMGLTMVELPFEQVGGGDVAVLYVVDSSEDNLQRVELNLREGNRKRLVDSDIPVEYVDDESVVRSCKAEAKSLNADVYIVTHPSSNPHGGLLVKYVASGLLDIYDNEHPGAKEARDRRKMQESFPGLLGSLGELVERSMLSSVLGEGLPPGLGSFGGISGLGGLGDLEGVHVIEIGGSGISSMDDLRKAAGLLKTEAGDWIHTESYYAHNCPSCKKQEGCDRFENMVEEYGPLESLADKPEE